LNATRTGVFALDEIVISCDLGCKDNFPFNLCRENAKTASQMICKNITLSCKFDNQQKDENIALFAET
jgi:hypothetical protein